MKNTDLGILIAKKNYSESSLILTFYTELNGLSSFIFKGARKKKLAIFHLGIYELTFFDLLGISYTQKIKNGNYDVM